MRKPMITRTINTTKAVVLCMDTATGTPQEVTVTLPRTYKDDKAMLKKARSIIETPDSTIKAVHVKSSFVEETLYGMSEDFFIANAEILPPRQANPAE